MKLKIKGPGLPLEELELDYNSIIAEELLEMYKDRMPYPVYCISLDNCYRSLTHLVHHECTIEFMDMTSQMGWLVYQNSLVLLYMKAVHDVLGKDTLVSIKSSFSKGLFTIIRADLNDEIIDQIQTRMQQLVQQDLPITKQHMNKKSAIELATKAKQKETVELLNSISSLSEVEIYSLIDEIDIFYGLLVPSTGYLDKFELKRYKSGVLLRYPHQSNPLEIPEYQEQALLSEAFREADKWDNLMGIKFITDLNKVITNNATKDTYLMQEALHEKKISDIADAIHQKKKRIVLICGPSSSGKTTFAKRLCIQLQVCGLKTLYMGTDDYFVNRDQTPLDENGEKDYESIRAVDTKLFIDNMNSLLQGKETDLPYYDFIEGVKVFGSRITKIDNNTVIVIEGIHALNGLLTDGIDDNEKFKIYISPLTAINIDHHNRISTTDCRLLRRMVRDYKTRGRSVQTTIAGWPAVRKGEDVNIFPFNGEADVFFNSYCIYETAALKKWVRPLLEAVKRDEKEYAEAQRLLSFLRYVAEANDEQLILNNSIIREFIGGSIIVE